MTSANQREVTQRAMNRARRRRLHNTTDLTQGMNDLPERGDLASLERQSAVSQGDRWWSRALAH